MAETTPPILNPSGKQQLRSHNTRISEHRTLITSRGFQDSINMALLFYGQLLAQNTDGSQRAAENMLKLKGAQEFVHQFVHLAEEFKPIEVPKPKSSALDHTAQ